MKPALFSTTLYDWPGETAEEPSVVPESEVTVWATLSLFVQVTLVPTFTVIADGLNAKFLILTETAAGAGTGTTEVAVEVETTGTGTSDVDVAEVFVIGVFCELFLGSIKNTPKTMIAKMTIMIIAAFIYLNN